MNNKRYIFYAALTLFMFMFAVIAAIVVTIKHIDPIDSSVDSSMDVIETTISETPYGTTSSMTDITTTAETTSCSTSSITITESITSSTTVFETTTIATTKDIIISIINPQIIVIPDETSKATTKTTKTTTVTTTTYSVTTITTVTSQSSQTIDGTFGKQFVGTFQGTYYVYPQGTHGGSGRELIDCSIGNGEVKGSISSRSLFNQFKYNVNGRTMVYIESKSCKSLCGYYYLDDSTAEHVLGVIDFFYNCEENSPFYGIGRLYDINVYV